jgi:hypothetical protein
MDPDWTRVTAPVYTDFVDLHLLPKAQRRQIAESLNPCGWPVAELELVDGQLTLILMDF